MSKTYVIMERGSGWIVENFQSESAALAFVEREQQPDEDWALVAFGEDPTDNALIASGLALRELAASAPHMVASRRSVTTSGKSGWVYLTKYRLPEATASTVLVDLSVFATAHALTDQGASPLRLKTPSITMGEIVAHLESLQVANTVNTKTAAPLRQHHEESDLMPPEHGFLLAKIALAQSA